MDELFDYQNNLKAIKGQLLRGWRVTVKSILQSVGTYEGRHYLSILRRDPDLIVKDEWVNKDGKRFKVYFNDKAA
jgi:hypothetical protein